MKNYNEMAEAVFRRRDEYLTARKKRNALLLKTAGAVCVAILVAIVGISIWKNLPDIPYVAPTSPTALTEHTDVTNDTQYTENITDTQTGSEATSVNSETKVPVLPPDPTEPSVSQPNGADKPIVKPSTNPTSATDPTEVPQDPTASTEPTGGGNISPVPTDAPVDAPTEPPWAEDPTEAPTAEPTETQPIAPSEPPMSELYIDCNGETFEAEIGDVVNITVELQSPELLKDIEVVLSYDDFGGKLKLSDESGLTTYEKNALHVPNIDPDYVTVNYKFNAVGKKGIKVFIDGEYEDFDFSEKKILCTFSFDVKKGGYTSIELIVDTITGVSGEPVKFSDVSFAMYASMK